MRSPRQLKDEPITLYEIDRGHISDVYEQEEEDSFRSSQFNAVVPLEFLQKHSHSLVWGGGSGKVDIPQSRFNSLRDMGKELFKLEKGSADTFLIRNVPIYKCHGDTRKRGHVSDRGFLDRICRNFYQTKHTTENLFGNGGFAWLPKWHIGHTPSNPDWPEKSSVGLIDNVYRVEDFLFGDIVGLDKSSADEIIAGRWPDRSAEIDTKRARLLSVAALGYRTPHFGLPQMRSEHLREQYRALVEKHSFSDEIVKDVFLREDFEMPCEVKSDKQRKAMHAAAKGKSTLGIPKRVGEEFVTKEKLSVEDVAKFFLRCEHEDGLREKFEAAKDEQIQKHFDMMGAAPQGQDLQGLIMQVIQQLMMKKQNTESNNPYQMNVSDALDFEATMHHSGGDQGFEEEGTDVAGTDDTGIRKGKKSGDSGVTKTGDPSESEEGGKGNTKTISSKGEMVEKGIAMDIDRIRHSFVNGNEEQRQAAMVDALDLMANMTTLVDRQTNAIRGLDLDRAKERLARRKEHFKNVLANLFSEGCAVVSSQDAIEKNLGILLDMNDRQADDFIDVLKNSPKLPHTKRYRADEVVRHDADVDRERNRAEFNEGPGKFLKDKMHMTLEDFQILNEFSGLQEQT